MEEKLEIEEDKLEGTLFHFFIYLLFSPLLFPWYLLCTFQIGYMLTRLMEYNYLQIIYAFLVTIYGPIYILSAISTIVLVLNNKRRLANKMILIPLINLILIAIFMPFIWE